MAAESYQMPGRLCWDSEEVTMVAHSLIASDRVEGTPVVRAATGEKMGAIQRLMIGKRSGKVAYAVLSFGGMLGFGEKHFPIPWRSLKYNPVWEAYESEITEQELRRAPSCAPGEEFDWGDRSEQVLARMYRAHSGWE
jgi:hypothetical protein